MSKKKSEKPSEEERQWLANSFAMLFLLHAVHRRSDLAGNGTDEEWRAIAVKVACLQRLGEAVPRAIRQWITRANRWLDREERMKTPGRSFESSDPVVFRAFRAAYEAGDAEAKQHIAATQDIYLCADSYHGCGEYMLETDESHITYTGPVYAAESKTHCDIIRDIFGNPFRPVAFDPKWRTEHMVGIALRMYEDRAFAAMPILADALEEAGCDSGDILAHCREPSDHVRGCWVVDLVLGK